MAFRLYNRRYPGRPVHSHHMVELFGLDSKAKWPVEGLAPVELSATDTSNGAAIAIKVWVAPFQPRFRKDWAGRDVRVKSSTHRVMCECPGCGQVLSAGRLFQHLCKPDRVKRYDKEPT